MQKALRAPGRTSERTRRIETTPAVAPPTPRPPSRLDPWIRAGRGVAYVVGVATAIVMALTWLAWLFFSIVGGAADPALDTGPDPVFLAVRFAALASLALLATILFGAAIVRSFGRRS